MSSLKKGNYRSSVKSIKTKAKRITKTRKGLSKKDMLIEIT